MRPKRNPFDPVGVNSLYSLQTLAFIASTGRCPDGATEVMKLLDMGLIEFVRHPDNPVWRLTEKGEVTRAEVSVELALLFDRREDLG